MQVSWYSSGGCQEVWNRSHHRAAGHTSSGHQTGQLEVRDEVWDSLSLCLTPYKGTEKGKKCLNASSLELFLLHLWPQWTSVLSGLLPLLHYSGRGFSERSESNEMYLLMFKENNYYNRDWIYNKGIEHFIVIIATFILSPPDCNLLSTRCHWPTPTSWSSPRPRGCWLSLTT